MMISYPARFESGPQGRVMVSFRDLPEAATDGADFDEALEEALDLLNSALGWRVKNRLIGHTVNDEPSYVPTWHAPNGASVLERPSPIESFDDAEKLLWEPWWLVTIGHDDPEDRYGPVGAYLAYGDYDEEGENITAYGRGSDWPLAIYVAIAKALASSQTSTR